MEGVPTLPQSLRQPMVFVDIETTGGSSKFARVLEVGAIRVEDGEVKRIYNTLLHPGSGIPSWITELTGIRDQDVTDAPQFHEIADELAEVLDGAVFVAHNVHFDYGFIRTEFDRLGVPFRPKMLCTVRLDRKLYPAQRRHNLASVIARLGIRPARRHRALDDAKVLWELCQRAAGEIDHEAINEAVAALIKSPSVPKELDSVVVDNLPDGPGVYIFKNEENEPIYIGKSLHIKQRVKSHFSAVHTDAKEHRMSQQVAKIETIETCGELGALLTEARLVKESKPVHNRALQGASMLTIARRKLNEDGQYVSILEDLVEIDQDIACDILGVFRSKGSARRFLTEIMQNFYLCPKLLGLEKSKTGCFRTQLSKCWGVCKGEEPATTYNLRFEQAFEATSIDEWPFDGPVTITETLPDGSRDDMVIFRWCLIERTIRRPDEIQNVPVTGKFDLDTYRIIRSHIRQGKAELQPTS